MLTFLLLQTHYLVSHIPDLTSILALRIICQHLLLSGVLKNNSTLSSMKALLYQRKLLSVLLAETLSLYWSCKVLSILNPLLDLASPSIKSCSAIIVGSSQTIRWCCVLPNDSFGRCTVESFGTQEPSRIGQFSRFFWLFIPLEPIAKKRLIGSKGSYPTLFSWFPWLLQYLDTHFRETARNRQTVMWCSVSKKWVHEYGVLNLKSQFSALAKVSVPWELQQLL